MELITISKIFILMAFIEGGFNQGGALSAEFNSEKACKDAEIVLVEEFNSEFKRRNYNRIFTICVPK